jgi:hypothetical protein
MSVAPQVWDKVFVKTASLKRRFFVSSVTMALTRSNGASTINYLKSPFCEWITN